MIVRPDCRHFPGDRPCHYHKKGLVSCPLCSLYAPRGKSILIVKLEALGDVLRTTSILPSLRRTHGTCYVTWIASEAARELFIGNPLVDEVLDVPSNYFPALLSRKFDVVINPDASLRSSEIAAAARGERKYGFIADHAGTVVPLSRAAQEWLVMGGSDQAKRHNQKTYQQILHEICGLDPVGQHIIINLTEHEKSARNALLADLGIDLGRPIVGVNPGAGPRWNLKRWRVEGFIEAISSLLHVSDAHVLLLGSEHERERNCEIHSHFDGRVSNPHISTLRGLVQAVDLCDVVLTGDTLALHVAAGLGKRVVALFGPTSHHEIDLYGRGTKIVSSIDCTCCYNPECDRKPNCMDLIYSEQVFENLLRELSHAHAGHVRKGEEEKVHSLVGEPGR